MRLKYNCSHNVVRSIGGAQFNRYKTPPPCAKAYRSKPVRYIITRSTRTTCSGAEVWRMQSANHSTLWPGLEPLYNLITWLLKSVPDLVIDIGVTAVTIHGYLSFVVKRKQYTILESATKARHVGPFESHSPTECSCSSRTALCSNRRDYNEITGRVSCGQPQERIEQYLQDRRVIDIGAASYPNTTLQGRKLFLP